MLSIVRLRLPHESTTKSFFDFLPMKPFHWKKLARVEVSRWQICDTRALWDVRNDDIPFLWAVICLSCMNTRLLCLGFSSIVFSTTSCEVAEYSCPLSSKGAKYLFVLSCKVVECLLVCRATAKSKKLRGVSHMTVLVTQRFTILVNWRTATSSCAYCAAVLIPGWYAYECTTEAASWSDPHNSRTAAAF